jgi:integrase
MRATPERLQQFARLSLQRILPQTVAVALDNLRGVFESLAQGMDWSWIPPMVRRVRRRAAPSAGSTRPFYHADVLLGLGQTLMQTAYSATAEMADPVAFRDGLMIALLATVPVRIHAFSLIQVGQHLNRQPHGKWTLDWAGDETKGRRPDHWPFPEFLVQALDAYLRVARPALMVRAPNPANAGHHLWVGVGGGPIGDQTIRKIIKARTGAALGKPLLPHAFRTSAATTYVLEHPEHAIEAAALLAHTDFRITEEHYLAGRRQLAVRIAHRGLERYRRDVAENVFRE